VGGTTIGILNQALRELKQAFHNALRKLHRKKGRQNIDEMPRSWERSPSAGPGKSQRIVVVKHKKRIPGLKFFKRALAGVLLLINFAFSQFILGSLGTVAQPMFILFLANSFILLDYLWKTRKGAVA